jgi:glutathione S-transferase
MTDTLTYFKVSQPGRGVRWFVKNNSIPITENVIQFGDNTKPEFIAKSPFQAVPILELNGGGVLTESSAIVNYLAAKYGKRAELPEEPLQLARVQEAQLRNNGGFARNVSYALFRPVFPLMFGAPLTFAAVQENIAKALDSDAGWELKQLDTILQQQKWIAGETFTVADYNVMCDLNQWPLLEAAGFLPDSAKLINFPGISRYLSDAKQVPNHDDFTPEVDFVVKMLAEKAKANSTA